MGLTTNFVLVDIDHIEAIKEVEGSAFEMCDKDRSGCLTWDEVELCIERYGPMFPDFDFSQLTRANFIKAAGEDECLTFEEWMVWQDKIIKHDEIIPSY